MPKHNYKISKLFSKYRNIIFVIVVTISVFLTVLGLTSVLSKPEPKAGNLLRDQDWKQFAGATTTIDGLFVKPLERIIVHGDGSLGQENPAVNLMGSHLSVSGDFAITAKMESINDRGTLRLYSAPPVVYDKWRYESSSISVDVTSIAIVVRVWDGSSSNSIDIRSYPFKLKNSVTLSIEHKGDVFVINANREILGSIPDHNVFDSGEVWLGVDGKFGDDWILRTLNVYAQKHGHVEIVTSPSSFEIAHDDKDALRNLADARQNKIKVGVAIAYGALVTNEEYRQLAIGQFNMLTPENGMKPQFIHPEENIYSFTEMDTLVDIAIKNNVLVHGHSLVYAKSSPEWMEKTKKENREKIMIDHITTVVDHFKGKVGEWDVVNEPFSNSRAPYHDVSQGFDENIWYEAMGEKYIDLSFETAHKADPSAILYLNDYGLERDGERWGALLGLIKRLKSREVPIHGIGFESHIYGDGDYSDSRILTEHMRILANMGLLVRISEIDVTGENPKEQTEQYLIALDACLRSPNCTGYSTWGVTDLYGSTTRSDRYPLVYGTSLLFDKDFKPKPAYSAIQARLKQSF